MKVYLIRHGEALSNVSDLGGLDRNSSNFLTERGLKQAKLLGKRFKRMKINAIYSSDIPRAIQTAEAILKYHPKLDLKIDKRLREHERAKDHLKTFHKLISKKAKNKGVSKIDLKLKGSESYKDVENRFEDFFEEIEKKYNGNVVIVAHAMANQIYLKGPEWTIDFSKKKVRQHNTCVNEFHLIDGKKELIKFGCIKHLDKVDKLKYYLNLMLKIPYRVKEFSGDIESEIKDGDCRHKTEFLKEILKNEGIQYRELVGIFDWHDLPIPRKILNILKKSGTKFPHRLLEVKINNKWIKVDPVWDRALRKRGFPTAKLSNWDGKNDTGRVSWGNVEYIRKSKYDKRKDKIHIDEKEAHRFSKELNKYLDSIRSSR